MRNFYRIRVIAGLYAIVWLLITVTFWIFCRDLRRSIEHIFVTQYIILPAITFLLSIFIGKEHLPMKYVWLVPVVFSVAYLLCRLVTQSLFQQILTGVAAFPSILDFLYIVIISTVGLLIGAILNRMLAKK